jgi:hypothetical protein
MRWLVTVNLRSSRSAATGNYQIAWLPTHNKMKMSLLSVACLYRQVIASGAPCEATGMQRRPKLEGHCSTQNCDVPFIPEKMLYAVAMIVAIPIQTLQINALQRTTRARRCTIRSVMCHTVSR